MPHTSLDDFAALVRRAGLPLSTEEIGELYEGWGYVAPLLERLRVHGRDRAAEPATIFRPDAFDGARA